LNVAQCPPNRRLSIGRADQLAALGAQLRRPEASAGRCWRSGSSRSITGLAGSLDGAGLHGITAASPTLGDDAAMKKAVKRHGRAKTIVTDGLRSYPAAIRERGNLDCREMGR